MTNNLLKNWLFIIPVFFFSLYTIWWIFLQFQSRESGVNFDFFASTYCLVALWGGFCGITIAQKWGGLKSSMGRGLIFFSLGLFSQAFGQLSYSYFVMIKHIEVPYPSLGDVGYFGSIFFYILGICMLLRVCGVRFGLRNLGAKILSIVIPVGMLIVAYTLFLQDYSMDWSHPLTVFLDFGYPMGEAIYISLAILTYILSKKVLGGIMRSRVLFLLAALVVQFIADYVFLYQNLHGTWQAAGNNDYLYLLAYFIMTISLLRFGSVLKKLQTNN